MPKQSGYDYGGQAVIEGVMIRGPQGVAIAVRQADGNISVRRQPHRPLTRVHPLLGLPLIRGAIALYEALVLGIDALLFSANEAASSEDEKLGRGEMVGTMLVSAALAIALFVVLPTWLVSLLEPLGIGPLVHNLVEGLLRLVVLLLYIL